ncbi:Z1 domain-containing protein [Flavitalea sp. BT771]|uniref:Z1 domain-containing protein n=1 Tax=Flavitalea sp. BT771 TaxID=3063329 RepID=UPI0026E175E2|nr:Z1 domain-containing protein [Flavitalea sp. BT771]MDO6433130.1 Z1 domain-containing protein [Flavitalea sp. BT771]MDV6221594.1 Z1 domain-containing protein [Flavitalea sp. BT771]
MNEAVLRIIDILAKRFRLKGSEFNLAQELEIKDPVTEKGLTEEEKVYVKKNLLTIIQYKESHDGTSLVPVSVVTDPKKHEEWYGDWLQENNNPADSYYWHRLEDFLSIELTEKYGYEKAGRIIRSIDEATRVIMRNLANPHRTEFSYKGLVVGYVQSGKTANFTALIAKAADAGYRLIIVLAGIHKVLRKQTQVRLDKELTGYKEVDTEENYIDPPGAAHRWTRLTTAENDFSAKSQAAFNVLGRHETPTLVVVKKNTRVLNSLIRYFSKASPDLRAGIPVLVIDDEADQASIDTNANNSDADLSKTNDSIRRLLKLFSKKAYVGYTATPFANVLIDMGSFLDTHEDDLYPRNFIVSLPEPQGYFGSSMIFSGDLAERFVKNIPDESGQLIRERAMGVHLSEAIDLFLLSCAVRNLRGDSRKPMSMLVHVTHIVTQMSAIYELIYDYVRMITGRYGNNEHAAVLKEEYAQLWVSFSADAEAINKGLHIDRSLPAFDEVWEELADVLSALRILELNSSSYDKLDYSTDEEVKVIAVGGNQLSRGLTLEGLMMSYYLRASKQYDTLLQMGRWFGYRQGYEDLTRVFTTGHIWESFEHLSLVESELRSEIYRYEDDGLTPLDMAVSIRAHHTLTVTAPNKMGAARFRKISYSKSINQTIWLPLDNPDMLEENYRLGESFIAAIGGAGGFRTVSGSGVFLADRKADGRQVLEDFLARYRFVGKEGMYGPGLDHGRLLEYINRRITGFSPELTQWSVAVAGNLKPQYKGDPVLYGGLRINRPGRSRKYTEKGYNIGVLTESDHLKIDLGHDAADPYDGRTAQNPLLLLYLIAKDSKSSTQKPNPTVNERIDLFQGIETEHKDVLGIAIVLPESPQEPSDYIGQ